MDLFASDVWGKLGVTFDATTLQYRRLRDRGGRRARRRSTTKRTSSIRTSSGKLDYNPTDRVNLFFRARRLRRGAQQRQDRRGQRHELEVRQRRRAAAICRRQQRRRSGVLRPLRFLPEHVRGAGSDAAAQPEQPVAREDTCRPMPLGSMVQWSRPFQLGSRAHVVSAGTDFRWIDGDSDEHTYALATGLTTLSSTASPAARSGSSACSRRI